MPFISDLINRPVVDVDGEPVGKLKEILARREPGNPYPKIVALEIRQGNQIIRVSIGDVRVLIAPGVSLTKTQAEIKPYEIQTEDLFLVRDILDMQIIDTNGVRVVRVNDLELLRLEGGFFVANVDIGGSGLMRRLGFKSFSRKLTEMSRHSSPPGIISWEDVELIDNDQPMRLRVPSEKVAELHPADLAEILSHLSPTEGRGFIESLDIGTLADTLEEIEPDFQVSLVETMSNERVADVLEEMEPDEAADLLAELPEDRSQEVLELMEDEEAKDVRKLLAYPEDTAGGIMTTEFFSIPANLTAGQVLKKLRSEAQDAETIFYIYVTDESGHLVGVFSLRELVLADPRSLVSHFMHQRLIVLNEQDSQDDCAQAIAKYNLLAIPVVDNDNRLHGIVTADDALDKIIPTAWKKRLPRLYH